MNRRPGYACLALGTLAVLATPVVVYWWVGDLSSAGLLPENSDYAVKPPNWSEATVRGAALGALCVLVATTGLLMFAGWRRLLRWAWLGVIALLVAASSILAIGYRVATAGVIGANIGFGFCLMFGVPLFLGLVVCAAFVAHRLMAIRQAELVRPA